MAFSWIDLAVVIAYIIAITAFGARFGMQTQFENATFGPAT